MNQEKVNNSGASEAVNLAWAITRVAETAANEEELRIGVEKLLEPTLQRLGISVQPRYERHIRRTILTAPAGLMRSMVRQLSNMSHPANLALRKVFLLPKSNSSAIL